MEELVNSINGFVKAVRDKVQYIASTAPETERMFFKVDIAENQCLSVSIYNANTGVTKEDIIQFAEILKIAAAGVIDTYLYEKVYKLIDDTK